MINKNYIYTILCMALLIVFPISRVNAANTTAGTTVNNQATINYQVNSISQTAVNSNSYDFTVDRTIDLTVATTDGAAVAVTPGSTDNVLTFTVTNTGNGSQDIALSATTKTGTAAAFTGTDDQDADSVAVYLESGATGGYQVGEDTATHIDALAKDTAATVYIVGDFDSGTFADGEIASYHLLAEARLDDSAGTLGGALTETAGADTSGEDTVFSDGQGTDTGNDAARDAQFSDDSDFIVSAANLSVTKSSTVVSDPDNSTTNPKAIPGAVIRYTITISNAADAATATDIAIADSLNTEIATNGTIAYNTGTIKVTAPNINSGSERTMTDASDVEVDGATADWNITATNTVTVTGIDLAASESATITFEVTIQ